MCTQVVAIFFQFPDSFFKSRITVKITCKEKRTFYFFLCQCADDEIATVGKFVTSKNNGDIFMRCITANDCATRCPPSRFNGRGCYFFFWPSASFAARRYINEAVPSIVGSLVL